MSLCTWHSFLAGPSLWVRGSLANYVRQSRTAAEPSWEEFPSLSRAATLRGFLPPFIHTTSPGGLPEVAVAKRVLLFAGTLSTGRVLGWEELLPWPVYYFRQMLSFPGATPPPTQTRTSGPAPGVSLRWPQSGILANDSVEGEGVVLCLDPSGLTHRKCWASLALGEAAPGSGPPCLTARPLPCKALQHLPMKQWSGSKFAKIPITHRRKWDS